MKVPDIEKHGNMSTTGNWVSLPFASFGVGDGNPNSAKPIPTKGSCRYAFDPPMNMGTKLMIMDRQVKQIPDE